MRKHVDLVQNSDDEILSLKIAILGKSLVGKSAIAERFIKGAYPELYDTTIEDHYKITSNIEGIDYFVQIVDTSGHNDYQFMLDSWISFGDGFLLVFSINDTSSYEFAKKRLEEIMTVKNHKIPIIVVGNKADLSHDRKIDFEEAFAYFNELGAEYIECSAFKSLNIKESFYKLFDKMIKKKRPSIRKEVNPEKKKCYCF